MIVNLNYIKALRAYNGLSQTKVAETLGCTYQTYNSKENGKTSFTLDELNKLAETFNVPATNFFKNEVSGLETKSDNQH